MAGKPPTNEETKSRTAQAIDKIKNSPPILILGIVVAIILTTGTLISNIGTIGNTLVNAYHYFYPPPANQPGHLIHIYRGHQGEINEIVWSADGTRITSGSSVDETVQTWNATTGGGVQTRPHYDSIPSTEVQEIPSPNGKLIVSVVKRTIPLSYDPIATLNVRDATTGNSILPTPYETDAANIVVWAPNNILIASTSLGKVNIWNALTGKRITTYRGNDIGCCPSSDFITGVAWSPDSQFIASSGTGGTMQIWQVTSGKRLATYKCYIICGNIIWSSVGSEIFVQEGGDNIIQYHSLDIQIDYYISEINISDEYTFSCPKLNNKSYISSIIALSPNNAYLAYSCDSVIYVRNIIHSQNLSPGHLGSYILIYKGHSAGVSAITWSPDSKYIASGSVDGIVQVWQAINF